MIESILKYFSNRELASLTWIAVIFLLALFAKDIRSSLLGIVKILIKQIFVIVLSLQLAYLICIIFLLKSLEVWDWDYLKDTLIWLVTVGLVMTFKANNVRSVSYFKKVIISSFKLAVFIEFYVGLYSFSYWAELVAQPLILLLIMLQEQSKRDPKHQVLTKPLNVIISLIGIGYLTFSIIESVGSFDEVFSIKTLLSFSIPIALTILFTPFIYLLGLFITYESFFVSLSFMYNDKVEIRKMKKAIILTAKFNLDKLKRIQKKFNKGIFYENEDYSSYLKKIANKKV